MGLKLRKSKAPPPPPGCPMAACMAVLGGAWTPSLIWKLSGGPRRFGELSRDIPGISPKMLTTRLRDLERKGVVIREVVPSSPPSVEYSLSELGRELVPVIDTIVRVGTKLRDEALPAAARRRA
ncbi:MAG: winged helix-turn-helix transcriptional regulator [Burkholderiales bacterium]